MEALSIDDVLADLVSAVARTRRAVLVAPPGAGKTTRVPVALSGLRRGAGQVVVLEPRRIAARAAARRVAAELGVRVGERVGHHVRFDRRASDATEILFCTEGVFLSRLQADPFLDGVAAVVFDEFHERSLDADLALAMAARTAREVRDDLDLVVMSATLDPEPVARFLGDAPVVVSEGRAHPVETVFVPAVRDERAEDHVARGVAEALERGAGDVLVFLAGVGEIRRAQERFAGRKDVDVLPLYGDLSPDEQDAALRAGPRRRVVLATNVAESSVTVAGVDAVVDAGTARVLRHDAESGVDRLEVERIDRAAADQRAGRAGRLGPGVCVRLWSAIDDRTLEPFLVPEIRRADLAGAALALLRWGERDLAAFPWFEAPAPRALRAAEELLGMLGATDASGRITRLGERIARLPLHPRLAALVLDGAARGDAEGAALAAAMLSEREPFRRSDAASRDACDSDVEERVRALEAFEDSGGRARRHGPLEVAPAAARGVLRVRDSVLRALPKDARRGDRRDADALARSVLAGFPDRLCVRREGDGARTDRGAPRARMVGGRGVQLGRSSGVTESELFVAVRVGSAARAADDDIVWVASGVAREWVDGGEVRISTRPVFDPAARKVVGKRREMLGALVLAEKDQPLGAGPEVEDVLLDAARAEPRVALGLDTEALERDRDTATLLARLELLRIHAPELELPATDDAALAALLPMLVSGARSYSDLQRRRPLAVLLGTLSHAQRSALDLEAPERIEVPSGSHLRLDYGDGSSAPVLAVKIQELFGLLETPRVARGRVPVLLHLLAPNGRPQQVTDDLASFWGTTYAQVRKDLRGRYPKHPWPENPLTAQPTARAKRRR
ncbi:MAG: ATP-dependent helicase HrpB [Planctomycetota bacterium]